MGVASVSATLSSPMSLEEAKAISKQTHLFGYEPEVFKHPVAIRLVMFSKADVAKVDQMLADMRSRAEPVAVNS